MTNNKAVFFSLDFLISLVITMLVLGIAVSHLEAIQGNSKELFQADCKKIATTASEIMIMDPSWTCFIASGNYYIPNCIDTTKLTPAMPLRDRLAIPPEYSYLVDINGVYYGSDCSDFNAECLCADCNCMIATITRPVCLDITTEDSWPCPTPLDLNVLVWKVVE